MRFTAAGLKQRSQDVHGRGLARPIRPDKAVNRAFLHVQIQILDRMNILVALAQLFSFDNCRHTDSYYSAISVTSKREILASPPSLLIRRVTPPLPSI